MASMLTEDSHPMEPAEGRHNLARVLVAVPHRDLRVALAALVASDAGLALAGAAGDVFSTMRLLDALQPDVVLVDDRLAGLGRDGTIGRLAAAGHAAVLVTGMECDAAFERAAVAAGAAGYVCACAPADEVLDAVHAAARRRGARSPLD